MKRLSLIIPIFAILFAVTGAFAMNSMNVADPQTVYYWIDDVESGNQDDCRSTLLEPCEGTQQECKAFVSAEGANRTIYEQPDCTDPYLMN